MIDVILTKSISRFARNTLDLLETVRHLRELGVEVRFEKERIDSLSEDGELMLTLLASFAQEESRSISENVKWAIRKGFEQGRGNQFILYGYRWDGQQFSIVPEEAKVILLIFTNFLAGLSAEETEKQLDEMGVRSYNGGHFGNSSIRAILRQERYTGNTLFQKTYVENHITHKTKINRGELPMYYAESTHPAIIDKGTFDAVQAEMARRRDLGVFANWSINTSCFTSRIKCGNCGVSYRRSTRSRYKSPAPYAVWVCQTKDRNLVINEEQAAIVRRIYGMFLQGVSPYGIAERLTTDGIPSPGGKGKWNANAVRSILRNEKYKGDALLQKSYTVDFLTKKKKANDGEIPQYYVENNHDAIIDPVIFGMVQREIEGRHPGNNRHSGVRVFSGKIRCGECGGLYGSKVWHSNDPYRRVIWQCNHKYDGANPCRTPHLDEETLQRLFVSAFNKLVSERDEINANFELIKETLYGTAGLEAEQAKLQSELEVTTGLVEQCVRENASLLLDQDEYQKRYDGLCARFESVKSRLDEVTAEIADKNGRRETIEQYLTDLMRQDGLATEFDPVLWHTMVDVVTVCSKEDMRFRFKDGTEMVLVVRR